MSRKISLGFYITGQNEQSHPIITGEAFKAAEEHYKNIILGGKQPWIDKVDDKKIKLSMLTYKEEFKAYFGAIARYRDEALPFIENTNTREERKIKIGPEDEVVERSYFAYFEEEDILVFQENMLGAKPSDLAYSLQKNTDANIESFETIWKSNTVKKLLETDTYLKKVDITIAIPRRFELSNFDLSSQINKDILSMMNNTGSSRLAMTFFGRASTKKSKLPYLSPEIKSAIKEMLERFTPNKLKGTEIPALSKAKLKGTSAESEVNLLDEKLRYRATLSSNRGYADDKEVFDTIVKGKHAHESVLKIYRKNAA